MKADVVLVSNMVITLIPLTVRSNFVDAVLNKLTVDIGTSLVALGN